MHDQLVIDTLWNPRHETDGQVPDHLRLKRREGAEDFRRTARLPVHGTLSARVTCPAFLLSFRSEGIACLPRTAEDGIPHHNELGDDAQDIQMRAVREEKVPELQDFRQRGRAGA